MNILFRKQKCIQRHIGIPEINCKFYSIGISIFGLGLPVGSLASVDVASGSCAVVFAEVVEVGFGVVTLVVGVVAFVGIGVVAVVVGVFVDAVAFVDANLKKIFWIVFKDLQGILDLTYCS